MTGQWISSLHKTSHFKRVAPSTRLHQLRWLVRRERVRIELLGHGMPSLGLPVLREKLPAHVRPKISSGKGPSDQEAGPEVEAVH